MATILNPIIPGMAPDPSILRVGDDYYIATSTFHWNPAVQVFHSTDFVNWELLTYILKDGEVNLQGTNTPAGIWAPHLSYDKDAKKFWLIYSHMQNMAGREFNAEAYAMSADDIQGPWSKPVYITSIGFDPSLYHENGRHYVACLEWETRTGYQAPGHLAIAEADLEHGGIVSLPDVGGHMRQPGGAGGTVAAFAADDLVAVRAGLAQGDGLDDAEGAD